MGIIQGNTDYFKEYKLHNPFLMKGMKDAIIRIIQAVNNREKIVVYGYGDVDSICGISILLLLLKYLNADVEYFIPDEMENKYGIGKIALNDYIKYLGVDVMITVGCGSNSSEEIRIAKNMGITVIVTDNHREIDYKIEALGINAKNKKCRYPFKCLSAVGTVFKLCEAISMYYKMKRVYKYIDLAMLGTIASSENIIGENKSLIDTGMVRIMSTNNYGIQALLKINKITEVNISEATKLTSSIIPTKASLKNMDNSRIAVELFTTRDSNRAIQIAKYLKKECVKSSEKNKLKL
ncbi:DHH family phosphoesterase [Clostridium akagii]|uniref:DHH family phosphoesterase n=1 Tax=Clostridium akagii TaxID=91623 RepID=UPI000478EF0E|nr:DHH family phosphoesterase [Clostridium akagii]